MKKLLDVDIVIFYWLHKLKKVLVWKASYIKWRACNKINDTDRDLSGLDEI